VIGSEQYFSRCYTAAETALFGRVLRSGRLPHGNTRLLSNGGQFCSWAAMEGISAGQDIAGRQIGMRHGKAQLSRNCPPKWDRGTGLEILRRRACSARVFPRQHTRSVSHRCGPPWWISQSRFLPNAGIPTLKKNACDMFGGSISGRFLTNNWSCRREATIRRMADRCGRSYHLIH
jgi:hypothetical protein